MKDEEKSYDRHHDMAAREMTVAELIDRRIEKAERQAQALRDLKSGMSHGFLQSGASRLASLLEI